MIRSVLRALDVLAEVAASAQPVDLSSITRSLKLPQSTVFRALHTLRAQGFLTDGQDGRYRVGPRAFEIGTAFLRGTSLWRSASEIVERLAEATGETANLGIMDGTDVLYIAIAHGQREIGIQSVAGTRHPLYCTALGKVLLAHLPWSVAKQILEASDLRHITPHTITTMQGFRQELEQVAQRGYAVDDEERIQGVRCIAAPVWDRTGAVVASLSIAGPAFRLVNEHFEETLRTVGRIANETSLSLGYRVPAEIFTVRRPPAATSTRHTPGPGQRGR